MLVDGYGRSVRYMRLSITDRCNLKCFYCQSEDKHSYIPHENILSYEEFLALAKAAQAMDVEKIRLTGGEPLVRRDFLAFLGMLKEECPGLDVRITTNGTLLPGKAAALKHLGVKRINISLDTMRPERFNEITGRDMFDRVLAGINECLHYGLRVKINVVAMKGFNDDELPKFLEFASENPVDVRFIEFMPIGGCTRWSGAKSWTAQEIIEASSKHVELEAIPVEAQTAGPARMFSIKETEGRIGVISPLTNHFCGSCNRLRITSDGRLRTCLFSDTEYGLRESLRDPERGIPDVVNIMTEALKSKPMGHEILEQKRKAAVCNKVMSSIGG